MDTEATITGSGHSDLGGEPDAFDREVDALVYELYGLTEEEIAVVEGVAATGRG